VVASRPMAENRTVTAATATGSAIRKAKTISMNRPAFAGDPIS
jgi:hypothetical protein